MHEILFRPKGLNTKKSSMKSVSCTARAKTLQATFVLLNVSITAIQEGNVGRQPNGTESMYSHHSDSCFLGATLQSTWRWSPLGISCQVP